MSLVIVPSIDLRAGKLVRLAQGDFARQTDYDLNPITVAQRHAQAGAKWLHIVDLDGAKEGTPRQLPLVGEMAAAFRSAGGRFVQLGGGVRSTEAVELILEAGLDRVVVGTKAIQDWAWFTNLAKDAHHAYKLVLALDAKDGRVATHGWQQESTRTALEIATLVKGWPLGGILYTDVARDGMLGGANAEATQALAEATSVPVIASGGVGNMDHLAALAGRGIWGVVLGKSLYEGHIDLENALSQYSADEPV
ncbi:MAG: 1-(5-phosphoribosyl)-5-[(5-phosphoribosylamino)methylideneamino]imidazole-4-carboxamide isomerase [Phycisphaerae bacterium]